ncbi:MAG: amidohydrolase family protein, partial [Planctomycetota bacterium]|nr:amidohydrolase family protein [Planctomycetota bacterium]
HVPRPAEVWRLITEGNAEALGWSDAGRLQPGAQADLLILSPPASWLDEHLVGRLLYNWTPRLIERVILAGRAIDPATMPGAC